MTVLIKYSLVIFEADASLTIADNKNESVRLEIVYILKQIPIASAFHSPSHCSAVVVNCWKNSAVNAGVA